MRREWVGNKVSDAQRHNPKLNMVEIAGLVAEAEHARAGWTQDEKGVGDA